MPAEAVRLGTEERPLRVAIVGSGPSGFFSAQALFKAEPHVQVDMFERLPTPYGLVRLGVAPDHQKIKSVTKVFERIAHREGFNFWGNVDIGKSLEVHELKQHYDAIVFAHGAETDRRLNIPGEDLAGSYTATEFVAWYNGHPEYSERTFDLSHEAVAIIGQGNVAIDVCRILAKTVDELRSTDIAPYALEALAESKIRSIHVIGRRGPVQAKCSHLELLELDGLDDAIPVVDAAELELEPVSVADLESHAQGEQSRVYEVLKRFSSMSSSTARRQVVITFRKSPIEIVGTEHVEGIVLAHNRLTGEPDRIRAESTDQTETLPCGLVFRSVGYRGVALPQLPFDSKNGVVPNLQGRVLENDKKVPGLYVAGWIKRGPSGTIGTNRADARDTVNALLEDIAGLTPCPEPDSAHIHRLLEERKCPVVSFADWEHVDAIELERGEKMGKVRDKLIDVNDVLHEIDNLSI